MKSNLYGFGQASYGELNAGISGDKFYYLNYLDNFQEIFCMDDNRRNLNPKFLGLTKKGKLVTISRNFSPVQIGNFNWKKIYAKNSNFMAIRDDGKLFNWNYLSSPVQIGNESWIETSLNRSIRHDGILFEGASRTVQVGNNTWSKVSEVGAIRSDGLLFTWGDNAFGSLGDNTTVSKTSPVQIGNQTWLKIDTFNYYTIGGLGYATSCIGIRSDGLLFTWGYNNFGELGLNATGFRSSPVQIGNKTWIDARALENAAFAIDSDYNLFYFGGLDERNSFKSGSPLTSDIWSGRYASSPVQIGTRKIKKIFSSLMFLDINNKGIARGETAFEKAPEISRYTFIDEIINLGNKKFKKISFNSTAAALDYNNNLWLWGNGYEGSMGNNAALVNNSSPILLNSLKYKDVSCSNDSVFAIREDGLLFSWGINAFGSLGNNTTFTSVSSPVQIGSSQWKNLAVYSSGGSSAAIRQDGALFTWGRNSAGNLGDGTSTISKSSPVQIGSQSWSMVACHGFLVHAIRSDGILFGWGLNGSTTIVNGRRITTSGGIGDNSAANRSSPVQIGNESWIQVCGSTSYTAAIRSDGLLFEWGYFPSSSSNPTLFSSPVQLGNKKWKFISSFNDVNLGIDEDYNLYNWRYTIDGNYLSQPVQISSKRWKEAYAGSTDTYFNTIIGLTKE